jgi:hypothetical protein
MFVLIRAYTPGNLGWAQAWPNETTPTKMTFSPSLAVSGPNKFFLENNFLSKIDLL